MPSGFDGNTLLDGGALAALTTYVLSLIKPFIEKLPFARPDTSTHDATLRIIMVLINVLTVVGLQYQRGTFNPSNWLAYLGMAIGQAIASQGLYFGVTSTSGAAQALKVAPPLAKPVTW